ncbi:hypothetical protein NBZ79_10985 [Sneathiella marina]|uniref:Uncharacterized protein n=1 Tax=Sneathiella marina TaxID=2950108 RepID=A0ABY4VXR5_9PROT|nr:hypothetical protein [Sneathiella marina]USG59705.1 hypothetical protein NBZ79_10985 [Sneathiella marina]
MSNPDDEKKYWLDDPKNHDKVFYGVLVIAVLVSIPDVLSLLNIVYHKHVEFEFENIFEFYSLYGLVCYVGLVLIAKKLRVLLKRDEDYYD